MVRPDIEDTNYAACKKIAAACGICEQFEKNCADQGYIGLDFIAEAADAARRAGFVRELVLTFGPRPSVEAWVTSSNHPDFVADVPEDASHTSAAIEVLLAALRIDGG